MLYLHSSFDLAPSMSLAEYRAALAEFTALMQDKDLLVETGPVLERCQHPIMDTDDTRSHRYFFVMTFKDRAQCDAAVAQIQAFEPGSDAVHRAIYRHIIDPIFSCWQSTG